MPNATVYPRGFQSPRYIVGPKRVRSAGDSEVMSLFNSYVTRSENVDGWEFRRKVLACAARLLHGFRSDWLPLQLSDNDHLYGSNFDFLVDTMRFVVTGNRIMRPLTWLDVMTEYSTAKAPSVIGNREVEFSREVPEMTGLATLKTEDVIQMWCSQENGFEDMLISLYGFFGPASKDLVIRQ